MLPDSSVNANCAADVTVNSTEKADSHPFWGFNSFKSNVFYCEVLLERGR